MPQGSDALADQLAAVKTRFADTLSLPEFTEIAKIAASIGIREEEIHDLAAHTALTAIPLDKWERLSQACDQQGIPEAGHLPQRFVLLTVGRRHLARIPMLPVIEEVKERLLKQFLYVCAPDRETGRLLNPRHYGFRVMCKFMRLERFPAGQSDWEVSGVPRSYLARVTLRDMPRSLYYVYLRAGGRYPFFEAHTSFSRELPILLEEDEYTVFRLLGGSLKLQPEIRGFFGSAWFVDPGLAEASPHLAWLSKFYEECARYGAVWTTIGDAPATAGFLAGDRRRKKLYESGKYKPRIGLIIWERRDLIRWHQERYGG